MLLQVILPIGLAVIMFSLGLGLTVADFRNVAKTPRAFAACFLSQIVLLPVVALIIVIMFRLEGMLAVGMMIIAFCPGGIPSNMLTRFAGGDVALSISLTAINSLIAVATIPFLVKLAMLYFMASEAQSVSVTRLSFSVFVITVLPVALGMIARKMFHRFISRLEGVFIALSTVIFFTLVSIAVIDNWQILQNNFQVLGPAVILLIVVMLLLGGLIASAMNVSNKKTRTIAIETAIQNGTMGVTVSGLVLLSDGGLTPISLPSALYGVLQYILLVPAALFLMQMARNTGQ